MLKIWVELALRITSKDRLDFEDYMRGHCWEIGQLNGKFYTDHWTRTHFAVWRDCAKVQRDRMLAANRHLSDIASDSMHCIDDLRTEIAVLQEKLALIGDMAHDASSGPAVPDAYWQIRYEAYAEVTASMQRMKELDAETNRQN